MCSHHNPLQHSLLEANVNYERSNDRPRRTWVHDQCHTTWVDASTTIGKEWEQRNTGMRVITISISMLTRKRLARAPGIEENSNKNVLVKSSSRITLTIYYRHPAGLS